MNRSGWRVYGSLLLCAALAGKALAQDPVPPVSDPTPADAVPVPAADVSMDPAAAAGGAAGTATVGNYLGYVPLTDNPFRPSLRVDTRAGNLYGYQDGFTNVYGWMPYYTDPNGLIFVDARALITNQGQGGANIGVGWRRYDADLDRIFTLAGWWDYDNGHARAYQQWGASFESLGRYLDYRVNGYMPFGQTDNVLSSAIVGSPFFQGNNILFNRQTVIEQAYTGFDAELGGPLPLVGRYGISGYAGGYWFTANHTSFTGVSGRAQAQITEDINLGVQVTHDAKFSTNTQLYVSLIIPDGKPRQWFRPLQVRDRLGSSMWRNYRVTASQETQLAVEPGRNPVDNEPFFVVFVDPNHTDPGSGTFEDPYQKLSSFDTLPNKPNVDIAFVFPGTEANERANLNTGVTLLSNQQFLSTSVSTIISTVQGTLTVPPITGPDVAVPPANRNFYPTLRNDAGNTVVTLAPGASNITVAGFIIDGQGTDTGLLGTNNRNVNINQNQFIDYTNGAVLTGLTGTGLFQSNAFTGNFDIARSIGTSQTGLSITGGPGTLDLSITAFSGSTVPNQNTSTGNQVAGYSITAGAGSVINAVAPVIDPANPPTTPPFPAGIIGQTATGNGTGFVLTADGGGVINATLDTNTATQNLGPTGVSLPVDTTGFALNAVNGGAINTTLTGNTATNNSLGMSLSATTGGAINATLVNNNLSNNLDPDNSNINPDANGLLAVADAGTVLLSAVNNTINGNQGDGVFLIARNGGNLTVPLREDLNNNGVLDTSISEDTNGNGALDPGEDLNGNGVLDTSLSEDLNGNGQLDLGFVGNTINNNSDNGVQVLADNTTADVTIGALTAGNTISGNGRVFTVANATNRLGSGIVMETLNNGTVRGSILNNAITNNVQAGIVLAPNTGLVDLNAISGNLITGNGDAIVFAPSNGGRIQIGTFTGNTISGNTGAIIRIGGNGGIIDLGLITDTTFDRTTAGSEGILFDTSNATISGIIRGNTFIGSAANPNLSFGIGGTIRGGTTNLIIEDNIFQTNGRAAIGFTFDNPDDRPAGTTGTPLLGTSGALASLIIRNNAIFGTLDTQPTTPDPFHGDGIVLNLQGQENSALINQNYTGSPLVPPPAGADPTTTIQPASIIEAQITGNVIGAQASNQLTDATLGNAGNGIRIVLRGDTSISDVPDPIGLAGVSGMLIDRNIIVNNLGDGINVRRYDSAIIGQLNVPNDDFTISNNLIQTNREDGIDLGATNNGLPYGIEEILNFNVTNNQILSNGQTTAGVFGTPGTGRGIKLRADGASAMEVNIADNVISGNINSGIEARTGTITHDFIGPTRDPVGPLNGGLDGVIYGVWERNTIAGNGYGAGGDPTNATPNLRYAPNAPYGHGIAIGRVDLPDPDVLAEFARENPTFPNLNQLGYIVEGFNNGGITLPDGTLPVLTVQDNLITANALDGIQMFLDKTSVPSVQQDDLRSSRFNFLRNDITNNGNDGLDLQARTSAIATINFNQNLVTGNGQDTRDVRIVGDGMELQVLDVATVTLTADQNRIKENLGRGVNILTQDSGTFNVTFTNNNISSNRREGFYLVNAPLNATVQASGTTSGFTGNTFLPDEKSNHPMFDYGSQVAGGQLSADNDPPDTVTPGNVPINQYLVPENLGGHFLAPTTNLSFRDNIVDNNGSLLPDPDGLEPQNSVGGFVMRIGTANQFYPVDPITGESASYASNGDGGVVAEIVNNRFSGNISRDVFFETFVATPPPDTNIQTDPLARLDLKFENNRGISLDVSNLDAFYTNTEPTHGGTNIKRPNPPFPNADVTRNAQRQVGPFGIGGLSFAGFGPSSFRIENNGAQPPTVVGGTTPAFIGNNTFNLIYSDFNPFLWQIVPEGTIFP